jgi:acetyl-CoA C-acetyltransferase
MRASCRFYSSVTKDYPVILSSSRTAIACFNGSLKSFTAPQLAAFTIKESINKSGIKMNQINEVYMGNVISAGIGQAPASQAAFKAGVPKTVPCTSVNKVCASGMKAVMFAAQSVSSGYNHCVVAGGMESMSNIPYYLPKARSGYGYGHGQVQDGILLDGLTDAYDNVHMGVCAEACSDRHGITREMQDQFALKSYRRAAEATKKGLFKEEIVAIEIKGKTTVVVEEDEEVFKLQVHY